MFDVIPVPDITAPTLRMPLPDRMIKILTFYKNFSVLPGMSLAGGNITDATVKMFIVIPVDKPPHPASGQFKGLKAFGRIVRTILARTEQRFGIWIVIADSGSAK